MGQDCSLLVPEDFVLGILTKSSHRERYQQFAFTDYVKVSSTPLTLSLPFMIVLRVTTFTNGIWTLLIFPRAILS